MMEQPQDPVIHPLLKYGRRGVHVKIWVFLRDNPSRWFTAQQIARYLGMPLSTVQVAVKDVLLLAPRVKSRDIIRPRRGRPEKRYRFQPIIK
jgi:hypothetical protein